MRTTETTAEIRSLTDVELDDVSGGVVTAAAAMGLFYIGLSIGMYWDLPAGAPKTLDEFYASW